MTRWDMVLRTSKVRSSIALIFRQDSAPGSALASIILRSMPFDQKSAPPSRAMTRVGRERLARDPEFRLMLRKKREKRLDDECVKPLASYRAEELARMRVNFFGPDPAYHEARRRFVFKGKPPPQESRAPNRAAVEPVPWFLSLGEARPGAGVASVP